MVELDHRSVCRKTGVSPEAEMDVVTGVELEYSYGTGDGRTRSGVASMPKERSGRPRLDRSCDWEKYGYDRCHQCCYAETESWHVLTQKVIHLSFMRLFLMSYPQTMLGS